MATHQKPESVTETETPTFPGITKGIVLVHGMGGQPAGETLDRWANPIVDYIRRRLGREPKVHELPGRPHYDDPKGVRVEISDESDNPKQTWLIVEAWWAESFTAAKFDPALRWSYRHLRRHLVGWADALRKHVGRTATGLRLLVDPLAAGAGGIGLSIVPPLSRAAPLVNRAGHLIGNAGGRRLDKIYTAATRWNDTTDEFDIIEEIQKKGGLSFPRNLYLRLLFLGVSIFNLINALMILILLLLGWVIWIVVILLLFALNQLGGVPGVPSLVGSLKKAINGLFVGSLGDIQVFLDHPSEASQIRAVVERSLGVLNHYNCKDLYLLAHSTGVPICYEVLTDAENGDLIRNVRKLFTVGSIMRIAWTADKDKSQGLRLPVTQVNKDIKWDNFWARYDPANPGPIGKRYNEITDGPEGDVKDIPVTNENFLVRDHVSYELNRQQVISRIVEDVWSSGTSAEYQPFPSTEEQHRLNSIQRIGQVVALAFPRMALIYLVPALLIWLSPGWVEWLQGKLVTLAGKIDWVAWLLNLITPWWENLLFLTLTAVILMAIGYFLYLFYRTWIWDPWSRREPS